MHNEYLQPLWEAFETYAGYPAVVDEDGARRTSYGDLGREVRRVMAWAQGQGLPPASFVPIILPSSMEYLACEIGLWMAGHTAVPMGPAFPQERIDYICEHCEAPLAITEATWDEIAATEPLDVPDEGPDFPAEEQPALLLYTSGSTGAPKGILHTFGGLAVKHTSKVGLTYSPEEVWGMGAPLYFVASLTCFKVLKEGGQLHLYSSETYRDMRRLEDYIVEHGVTFTFLSPAMLGSFNNRSDTLKVVFTGSERLTGQCSRDGYKLLNCYGMSETGGTVCAFEVKHPYDVTPVGRPEETWCLLGDDGEPVEVGEEGEMCLSGAYCAGYYKDDERTAELYRDGWLHTGDILRELPDGNLVYVNRKDWMAKINGQRVEPGEVENAIRRVDGVDQAVVKAFENEGGSQYLCAFIVGEADGDAVRDELAASLPPYMVPSFFVKVSEFALLPNGKVNRKVLAPPDASALQSGYVAPTTDEQARLCEAYCQVFGLERVGIDDDFFLLGGDSIRVMKLQELCDDLPLTTKLISAGRTPRKIAAALADAAAGSAADARGKGEAPAPRDRAPLSQTQLGIYAESMARAGEAVYNNPVLLRLDSAIDEGRLARAVEAAIEAHAFVKLHVEEDADGSPVMVAGTEPYRQEVETMGEEELERLKPSLIQPFSLSEGPLFRIRIIRTPEGLYLFSDFHHIAYDGTSARVLMADIDRAYAGEAVEPERHTGFDVALEEAEARGTDALDEAREYYQSTFGGLDLDSAPIPDRSAAEVEYATLEVPVEVDAGLLERFCAQVGVTPNAFAIAAFGRLLGAFANDSEALFATIYNGRADMRFARTVDMMVKTLPVHCSWDAGTRVVDYLRAVKEQVLRSMANDLFSFAEVTSIADVSSDVLFAYQGSYLNLGTVCGSPYERVPLESNATGGALDFQLFSGADGLLLRVEYQRNRYSDEFVENMAASFGCVVRGLLACERVADIELSDADQLAVLDSFNDTDVPYDSTQTVVSLLRSAAAAYPDNVAVVCGGEKLTYRELDAVTDAVAAGVRELGLGRGNVVAALVPRGLLMPIASIGALKAGCAYQPLDPTYPSERLNFMVGDSDAGLLLTTDELRGLITDFAGEVLCLGAAGALLEKGVAEVPATAPGVAGGAMPDGPVAGDPEPDDLFVLLYTSGTTGVPKGVRLTHRNLVCFINWYQRHYGLGPAHRVSAYASYGFDANMMETYPALSCGAAVVIVPEEMRLDLMAMSDYLSENGVTHAFMTTQVGRQFAIDAGYPSLEHLSMGGEALVPFEVPEHPAIHNLYGPSECTVLVTTYQLQVGDRDFPIGKIIDNMRGYVVDAFGHRVPVGAAGELWVAGPQVGDGYLNRPEKTAEAFGTNPFEAGDHASLYRTGDVVRYRPDGTIEFIGRRDGQVKIRGFRIELSEVEAVVRDYPPVRDATVAAFDHPSGGKFVAAYVVADEPIDELALGDFIRERKPPYLVPAAIVQVERIPLNQNGKVNRRALPVPELTAEGGMEDEEPRTLNALEEELLAIAQEVIGAEGFGITVPLVRCGLTSIQSIRLLTLVYKRFGVSIRAKDLPTDASVVTIENEILSAWMRGNASASASGGEAPRHEKFRAPLTFAQTGVYYECLKEPGSVAYNIPALFRFDATVDADELADAVSRVAAAHPTLAAHFVQEGEEVLLEACEGGVDVARVELSQDGPYDLDDLKKAFVRPFNLDEGPLARFAVAACPDGPCLLADFHHLAFDGASMGIFLRDLAAALGGDEVLAEDYTFADHARDERLWSQSDEFEASRRHFDELFADFDHASELPADKAARAAGHRRTATVGIDLGAIERHCRDAGVTPADFMLAACAYALSRYANERRVHLVTISNGRSDVRCSGTVGMFVNTLPLAIDIPDEDVGSFVARCAAALGDAVAYERYPFARVASDYGFAPQFMYEYQLGVLEDGDVGIRGLESVESLEADAAKFKCTVRIEEADGRPCVALHYDDAFYTAELAREVARSIAIVAEGMLAHPEAPVRSVSLVDDARRAELERFHQEASGPVALATYHEGLEVQAGRQPDATALVASDATLTFGRLNALANRIAHALMERGVPQRSRIALLLPRTSRVVLAMFGVMKAGCAYIPCDPAYPEERVRHILGDSKAALVVTTADRVGAYENAVDVEELLACEREDNPALDVAPDDLAYLIYTSGSTGKPKGVMLTHAGVCNFHADHPSNILVHALKAEAHALLAVTTLSFDMSVKEVGTPLVNGLTVVLAGDDQVNDPVRLAELFERTGADAINATHSRLKQYLQLPAFAKAIGRCKVVLSGGERYTEGLLPLLRRTTDARIINTYGPTETTVSSNMADLTHAERITVGRPLYNVWECIVDADGNELPAGVVGELLIGGPGVARGYNDLPDKTAEAFVERDGRRLYRSGDYARWTSEGNVEILGRTDNQIKLRGLRIEIGEVESALAGVEGVDGAVVTIARIRGAEHLCAYYTSERPLDAADVRAAMSSTLARYMVPTAYLQLDALPLTPNGKVDYRSLPPAELLQAGGSEPAANDVEQFFCDAFATILGLPGVGATDSFFEIGGTSLMAIRVTVEAAAGGYQVSYADVFANPTPRELARLCAEGSSEEADLERDPEIEDFDYAAIDGLLAGNNLLGFTEGKRRPLGNILLTGAAGYLGIHILHEYLESHDGIAYCLLRPLGDVSAETRLKHQLFYYFERNYAELFGSRIVVLEGDVTKEPPMGANMRIDTVINCAAVVKHFSSGTEIEDVNVGGVANLVEFCLARDTPLVQVSTGSTVKCALRPDASVMGKVGERQLYIGQDLTNKYVRSKFLAERLVLDAVARRGLHGKVMRVGNLAPRTADGEFQINYGTNAAMGRLKSFALLGCAPFDQLDATMEFSPIDQTARAILLLAQTPDPCVLFHPFNHHAVLYEDVFAAMKRCGLPVRPVEREEFARVLHDAEEDPETARVLTSMLAYARTPNARPVVVPQAGNAFTMQVLYRMGFSWNPTSSAYVEQFLEMLEGLGFFDAEDQW